jgi:hypothetical protein
MEFGAFVEGFYVILSCQLKSKSIILRCITLGAHLLS